MRHLRMGALMHWLKRFYWRHRWAKSYAAMKDAKEEYEALIEAGSMQEATRAYRVYAEHRRASIHYAMKMARK